MMARETTPGRWGFPVLLMDPDSVADRALNGLGGYIYDEVFVEVLYGDSGYPFRRDRSMDYVRQHLANEIRRDLCE